MYVLKPLARNKAVAPVPDVDLLEVIKARSGNDSLSQAWLDAILPEMMAYLLAIPAKCKRNEWEDWDDIPALIQAILVGVFARQAATGNTNVVMETIGDYQVKYSDPALFEGRIPRWFNDGEELAISRLAGCGGSLKSVNVPGIPPVDHSRLEENLYWDSVTNPVHWGGSRLPPPAGKP